MGNWSAEGTSLGSGRIAVVFMLRLCGCAAGDTNLCEPQVGKLQVDIWLVGEGSAEVGYGKCCRLTVKFGLGIVWDF